MSNSLNITDSREELKISPDTIRRMEFDRTPLGRRGYAEESVHRYLGRVAEALAAADADKSDLRAEVQRLRNYYHERGIEPDTAEDTAVPSAQAVNTLSLAQQAADQHLAQAETQARGLLNSARQQYESIVEEAHRRAEQAAEQARTAVKAGGTVTTDGDEQAQLEARVAYLRTFADVTQVQVRSILDALRTELDRLAELEVSRPV